MLDLYTPFQDETRKLSLLPSLYELWRFHQGIPTSGILKLSGPPGFLQIEVYAWELDILSREILLNAGEQGSNSLRTFPGIVRAINHIRRINQGLSEREIHSGDDALRAMHQHVHQQIRWQHTRDEARLIRTFKVFGYPDLERVFVEATGVPVRSLFFMGLAIRGALNKDLRFNANQDFTEFGIEDEVRDSFFRLVSTSNETIRDQLRQIQKYDSRWAYTWNPLESKPFIFIGGDDPSHLWCPLPTMLFRRITEGLFYDLLRHPSYSKPYGAAFEAYVGDVLHEIFLAPKYVVTGEEPYRGKQGIKHGTDWIVSDATSNIFIECKTKRMKHDAKTVAEGGVLESELVDLAKAIAQLYANIDDALAGRSQWTPNNRPVHPFVVTYEDWYLFTPQVVGSLKELVISQLKKKGLSVTLLDSMPYVVTSIAEFEVAAQAIAQIGIDRYCSTCSTSSYSHFQLSNCAHEKFGEHKVDYQRLFGDSWGKMFPSIKHLLDLPTTF